MVMPWQSSLSIVAKLMIKETNSYMYSADNIDLVLEPGYEFFNGIMDGIWRVRIGGWQGWLVGVIIAWLEI